VLSVVVIAKNEALNLPRCLASVARVAEEVVVVDSGSTDATKSIAEAHGARVFDRGFTTYADQKNWAASQALQPFVLSCDADEALGEELLEELLTAGATFAAIQVFTTAKRGCFEALFLMGLLFPQMFCRFW